MGTKTTCWLHDDVLHDDVLHDDVLHDDVRQDTEASPGVCATDLPLACWEGGTADGVRMKSTESDATEERFMVGKSFTCGHTVEGLP